MTTRTLLVLLLTFVPVATLAQTLRERPQRSERARVETATPSQDPFALRAAKQNKQTATPSQTPTKRDQTQARNDEKTTIPSVSQGATNAQEDVIFTRDDSEPIRCDVLSINGRDGLIASVDGNTQTYPLEQIASVELRVSESFRNALDAYERGKERQNDAEYLSALELFKQARQNASRRFEKEWATAKIAETYQALGRDDEAAAEFFLLCRIDPLTIFLPSIPLRWVNQSSLQRGSSADARALTESAAVDWLSAKTNPTKSPNATGQLLAASILLNSPRHSQGATLAMQALAALEPDENASDFERETTKTIALLAVAQLWRNVALRKPTERDVKHWRKTIESLPSAFRVEPLFIVAQAERTLGNEEEAKRDFLRVAMLKRDRFALADAAERAAGLKNNR